jgi:D-alanine-D-alanine ligase
MAAAVRDVAVLLPDPRLPDATKVGHAFSAEDLEAIERLKAALAELEHRRLAFLDDHASLPAQLAALDVPLVMNLCDTGLRNVAAQELHVPALLEVHGLSYTGSPPACLGLCFDKANVRAIAADCGVPVPAQVLLRPDQPLVEAAVPLPAIVKPNRADGGFGITAGSVAHDGPELRAAVARVRELCPGQDVLVQEFLTGEEVGIGLVGNPGLGLRALPPLAVDWSDLPPQLPRLLGYESKALPDSPYWRALRYQPAELPPAEFAELEHQAEVLFARLGCRDYARFDYRARADGALCLLEVNPNPAWCWDGKMNLMASFAGVAYSALLEEILVAAERRLAAADGGASP